jgi:hypothetical protein
VFDFSSKIMKANHHTIISFILAIFLSFFTPLNGLGLSVFSDNMYTESFRQESCINLQFASILKNNNDFEDDTPDDDLSAFICLTNNHLHDIGIYSLYKNYVCVKQIVFFDKTSRSPPFI